MVKHKETVNLQVEGMDCANCATSITRFLERKGLEDVYVNFQTKEVRYRPTGDMDVAAVKKGINKLGYTVVEKENSSSWWTMERKLIVSAIFTAPLLIGHLLMVAGVSVPFLENGLVQLGLALPAFLVGTVHFGGSALRSIRGGVPNMDVLIFMGSTAAFVYSSIGLYLGNPSMYFFETAATIITLVLVGNWLEERSVARTTDAIEELSRLQVAEAKRVMPSGTIVTLKQAELKKGYILQVNEGDKIPVDGRIVKGDALIDESMLTGESEPVSRKLGEDVVGASLLLQGNVQVEVTATGKDTVLQQIIELVKTAQEDRPPIQRLADQISAVFVPVVLGISLLTFLAGHIGFGISVQQALMNAIAVLVISCPCAMGLATPTAIMVGVGRLAKTGILIRGGRTVEQLARVEKMIFDKTGTLTTGQFRIDNIQYYTDDQVRTRALLYRMEQHSSHPIAQSLLKTLESQVNGYEVGALAVTEEKGRGLKAVDDDGKEYWLGSAAVVGEGILTDAQRQSGSIFLLEEDRLLAAIQMGDDLRQDAAGTVDYLHEQNIQTILLSGDRAEKTQRVAETLGIATYHAEQLPEQKLRLVESYAQAASTAMVGDGINDAAALARANVGISLSNASQVAIQSASVVLLNGQLGLLPQALSISKATVLTIRQNLFWAFAYNIVAIPIAAVGLLNPMWGALFMAFSDVVVIGNSLRLRSRKIK